MDVTEQRAILEGIVRDPDTAARERVSAIRLLREMEVSEPPERDAEVLSVESFMERRRRADFEVK